MFIPRDKTNSAIRCDHEDMMGLQPSIENRVQQHNLALFEPFDLKWDMDFGILPGIVKLTVWVESR